MKATALILCCLVVGTGFAEAAPSAGRPPIGREDEAYRITREVWTAYQQSIELERQIEAAKQSRSWSLVIGIPLVLYNYLKISANHATRERLIRDFEFKSAKNPNPEVGRSAAGNKFAFLGGAGFTVYGLLKVRDLNDLEVENRALRSRLAGSLAALRDLSAKR